MRTSKKKSRNRQTKSKNNTLVFKLFLSQAKGIRFYQMGLQVLISQSTENLARTAYIPGCVAGGLRHDHYACGFGCPNGN